MQHVQEQTRPMKETDTREIIEPGGYYNRSINVTPLHFHNRIDGTGKSTAVDLRTRSLRR